MQFRHRVRRWLLNGLLITVPIALSYAVMAWFVHTIDRMIAPPIERFVGHEIPGLGLVSGLLIVIAAGALGSNLVGQYILELTESLLLRIPVFNWLYRTVKQVTELFSPGGKVRFKRVVLVEFPSAGRYSLGFVTRELKMSSPNHPGERDFVCVYVPSNHMHFGQAVILPASKVRPTNLGVQQGVQGVLSAGATLPEEISEPK